MAKFCPQCGTPATGGKFCSECGHQFANASTNSSANANANANAIPIGQVAAAAAAWAPKAAAFQQTYGSGGGAANGNGRGYGYDNGQYGQQGPAIPVATIVNGAAALHKATSGMSASSSSMSMDMGASMPPKAAPFTPAPAPASDPVPPAATGSDAQKYYDQCLDRIRNSRGGRNEDGVKAFKQNCRLFGLRQMDVQPFYASLVRELGAEATIAFVPDLARLVPDDARRQELVEYNARQRAIMAPPRTFPARDSGSSSGYSDRGGSTSSGSGKRGIFKGRYADHPNCDVCNVAFDVAKRRHQCRRCGLAICGSCSPLRMLIPDGMQCPDARTYDVSIPQRVCIQCAPQLHQYQDQLVAEYAQANAENIHEAKGRIHVPFSSSLQKECQNAADIIGNFFRDEWGSSKDRSIPSALLQKAHGLAVMTIIKAGFMVTGQIGTGLVVAKLPDGTWSAPSAIGTVGLSGGFQIGGELIEVMIILGSAGAVRVFHKPQVNLGAGLDVAVGPYGRSAAAAAAASTSGLNANYSYSQSKGFYAGVSLQGTIITARNDLNRKFYARDMQPMEILTGHVAPPNAAKPLYDAIERAMQGVEEHQQLVAQRNSLIGPCRLCNCPMFVEHTTQVWNKNCKNCKHVH